VRIHSKAVPAFVVLGTALTSHIISGAGRHERVAGVAATSARHANGVVRLIKVCACLAVDMTLPHATALSHLPVIAELAHAPPTSHS
jgi:hypothetical protein